MAAVGSTSSSLEHSTTCSSKTNALKSSGTTFHVIVPGKIVYPLGRISLEVVFRSATNFHKETLDFEVVDWKSNTTQSSGD